MNVSPTPPRDRLLIFILQMLYLTALVTVAALYFTDVIEPRHQLGSVHVAIPWFGALGAVLISLMGIVEHPHDWNHGFRLWHVSRPFIGAIVGTVGVMIFQAGILAVGADPNAKASEQLADSKNTLYFLIAFLVGYRESTFRDLIKRLVDVVLSPGPADKPVATILGVEPASGPLAGGGEVAITGTGLTSAHSVKFGSVEADFTRESDAKLIVKVPAAALAGTVPLTVSLLDGGKVASSYTYGDAEPESEPEPEPVEQPAGADAEPQQT